MSWKTLARLLGPSLTAQVSAALHGRRVRIGKKPRGHVAAEYRARRAELDAMPAAQAAVVLGCGVRYVYLIRKSLMNDYS